MRINGKRSLLKNTSPMCIYVEDAKNKLEEQFTLKISRSWVQELFWTLPNRLRTDRNGKDWPWKDRDPCFPYVFRSFTKSVRFNIVQLLYQHLLFLCCGMSTRRNRQIESLQQLPTATPDSKSSFWMENAMKNTLALSYHLNGWQPIRFRIARRSDTCEYHVYLGKAHEFWDIMLLILIAHRPL